MSANRPFVRYLFALCPGASVAFQDWLSPTREDRILVYDKGAYVMHLLRKEMGERAFWNGLRAFSRVAISGSPWLQATLPARWNRRQEKV